MKFFVYKNSHPHQLIGSSPPINSSELDPDKLEYNNLYEFLKVRQGLFYTKTNMSCDSDKIELEYYDKFNRKIEHKREEVRFIRVTFQDLQRCFVKRPIFWIVIQRPFITLITYITNKVF